LSLLQADKLEFRQNPTFEDCFPSSEKVYKEVEFEGETLHVPVRRVTLTTGGLFDIYDTSGPQVTESAAAAGTSAGWPRLTLLRDLIGP
jgi:hypothetical protein